MVCIQRWSQQVTVSVLQTRAGGGSQSSGSFWSLSCSRWTSSLLSLLIHKSSVILESRAYSGAKVTTEGRGSSITTRSKRYTAADETVQKRLRRSNDFCLISWRVKHSVLVPWSLLPWEPQSFMLWESKRMKLYVAWFTVIRYHITYQNRNECCIIITTFQIHKSPSFSSCYCHYY